jgi:hypothetical protein
MHSFSHAHCLAAGGGRRSCLALYGSASGSGLRSPYASSPTHQAVSCSTLLYLWTGSSSPVASHPAFRRRSFLRLRTASVLSDGDFHPTVGAHSQAHVGTRSRAIRRSTFNLNFEFEESSSCSSSSSSSRIPIRFAIRLAEHNSCRTSVYLQSRNPNTPRTRTTTRTIPNFGIWVQST